MMRLFDDSDLEASQFLSQLEHTLEDTAPEQGGAGHPSWKPNASLDAIAHQPFSNGLQIHPASPSSSEPSSPPSEKSATETNTESASHHPSLDALTDGLNGNGTAAAVEAIANLSAPASDSPNGSSNQPPEPPPEEEFGDTDDLEETGFTPVLQNRNFLTLWAGQVFSQLADKVYLVLMIMIITSQFQAEGQTISGWVSAVMIAFTIPAVLFGSIAGVYVDHWSKKMVLVATNLLRGGLVLSLPPLLWITHSLHPISGVPVGFAALLGITFLVSTLTQFFAPAEQVAIPLIVERKHLLSANSLYTTTMMASVIIGFAVGEPLLAIADHLVALINSHLHIGKELLVGFSYVIAGSLLLLLRTNEKADYIDQPPPKVWENIRDGLRYLGQQRRVRAALIQLVILFSIFAALAVLAVRLAEVMPALKSSQFGFLLAAGGVGMALGAVIIGHFGQRFPRNQLGLWGAIGMAISLAAVSLFTQQLVPTLFLLACLGGFAAIVGVPMQTAIQEETPEEMRGKVFGLQNNAINIALSLPLALAGVAETYFGLRVVMFGLAGICLLGGILSWSIAREAKNPSTPENLN